MHREMRLTATARAKAVAEVVCDSDGQWLVWCNTDYEADALIERIPYAGDLRGKTPEAKQVELLEKFASGKLTVLITKPSICGAGLNLQHCHQMAFVGLSFSFEQFFQSVRRCWRFGQTHAVRVAIVQAETEGAIERAVREKSLRADHMQQEAVKAMREVWAEESAD